MEGVIPRDIGQTSIQRAVNKGLRSLQVNKEDVVFRKQRTFIMDKQKDVVTDWSLLMSPVMAQL